MELSTAITLGITISTFILGIVYKLIDISIKFGKFQNVLETNERADREERKKSAEKFAELFGSRNTHDKSIARLEITMTNISEKLEKMDCKLDQLIQGGR